MARSGLKFSTKGIAAVRRALEVKIPKEVRTAARKGTTEATKLILATEKPLVAVRTKSLVKSLGRKVIARRDGKGYIGVVGPRRDPTPKRIAASEAEVAAGKRKRALKGGRFRRQVAFGGRTITVNPANIAHLVEGGRKSVRIRKKKALSDGGTFFGKSVDAVAPRPFRKPAWQRSKSAAERAIKVPIAAAVAATAGRRR